MWSTETYRAILPLLTTYNLHTYYLHTYYLLATNEATHTRKVTVTSEFCFL